MSEQDGKTYPVAWINQFGKTRVFGTPYGHSDDAWRDANFLTHGFAGTLWAAGQAGRLTSQRGRIGDVAFVEIHVFLGQVGGIHHGAGLAEVQADVQLEFLRARRRGKAA